MDDLNKKKLEKLESIEVLLKHILAIQLCQAGVNQETIARHLKIAKAKVNKFLKGIKTNENTKSQNS